MASYPFPLDSDGADGKIEKDADDPEMIVHHKMVEGMMKEAMTELRNYQVSTSIYPKRDDSGHLAAIQENGESPSATSGEQQKEGRKNISNELNSKSHEDIGVDDESSMDVYHKMSKAAVTSTKKQYDSNLHPSSSKMALADVALENTQTPQSCVDNNTSFGSVSDVKLNRLSQPFRSLVSQHNERRQNSGEKGALDLSMDKEEARGALSSYDIVQTISSTTLPPEIAPDFHEDFGIDRKSTCSSTENKNPRENHRFIRRANRSTGDRTKSGARDKYGNYYKGDMHQGRRDGFGSIIYGETKDKYVGGWKNDYPHGEGMFIYADGCGEFKGIWKSGRLQKVMQGFAKVVDDEGIKYRGTILNGLKHGNGTLVKPDGEKYVGGWENDLRHGFGLIEYPDGSTYEGMFKHDQPMQGGRTGMPRPEAAAKTLRVPPEDKIGPPERGEKETVPRQKPRRSIHNSFDSSFGSSAVGISRASSKSSSERRMGNLMSKKNGRSKKSGNKPKRETALNEVKPKPGKKKQSIQTLTKSKSNVGEKGGFSSYKQMINGRSHRRATLKAFLKEAE